MNIPLNACLVKSRIGGALAALVLVAGCSDRELEPYEAYPYASSSASSSTSSSYDPTSSSSASSTGGGGAGGEGGSSGEGGSGGQGAGGSALPACEEPAAPFEASLVREDGKDACGPAPAALDLRGVVVDAASQGGGTLVWRIQACPVEEPGCVPLEYTLTVKAEGLAVAAPADTFVRLRFQSEPRAGSDGACDEVVTIENLPSLGGTPNPTTEGSGLWLAGSTSVGKDELNDGRFLRVHPHCLEEDACAPSGEACGACEETLEFCAFDDETQCFFVKAGESVSGYLLYPGILSGQMYHFKNIRSYAEPLGDACVRVASYTVQRLDVETP